MHTSIRSHQGFTIIELILVIFIIAVVSSFGIAHYRNTAFVISITHLHATIIRAIHTAKITAITNNHPVNLCAVANITATDINRSTCISWKSLSLPEAPYPGWIMLSTEGKNLGSIALNGDNKSAIISMSNSGNIITFSPQGLLKSGGRTIRITCAGVDSHGIKSCKRSIIIAPHTGRVRSQEGI